MKNQLVLNIIALLLMALANVCAASMERIVIFTAKGPVFETVIQAMVNDLKEDFIFTVIHTDGSRPETLAKALDSAPSPKLAVLLGNTSVKIYKDYQKKQIALHANGQQKDYNPIPSVALLGLQLDQEIKDLENATGILYEVPMVTAAVKLRTIMGGKLQRIGVVHRPIMQNYVTLNAKIGTLEDFELVAERVTARTSASDLKRALKQLSKRDVDAIWVLNDSQLLTPRMVRSSWIKQFMRMRIPVIVGAPNLVNATLPMGVLSVHPDLEALGLQASNMILEIKRRDWDASEFMIQHPLSVSTKFNFGLSKQWRIPIDEKSLQEIDELIE